MVWCFRMIFYYFMRALTSAFGLAVINTIYLFAGAWIFFLIEGPSEESTLLNLRADRDELVNELHKIVDPSKGAVATAPYETEKISEALASYETALAEFYRKRTITGKNKVINDTKGAKLWTRYGAVIYAFSVITTIGWGNIVPDTPFGRMATIFYGFVGIPLVFTLSSEVGSFTTKAIRLISYIVTRIFGGGQSREDKTMNRPLKITDDPAIDTVIRLDTSAAIHSGYSYYPYDGKYPPGPGTGAGSVKANMEDIQKDFGGGGDYIVNNNSNYLRSLDSTIDFLLEISRDPNIWTDEASKESGEDAGRRELLGQMDKQGNLVDILSKPRYRLSTKDDAELLSKQLDSLPLENFCRVMRLVGFDFEREILLQVTDDSADFSSNIDTPLEKSSDHRRRSREPKRQKKKEGKSDCLDAERLVIETRNEFENTHNRKLDEQKATAVEATDDARDNDTFTLQNENNEERKHKRKPPTSAVSHVRKGCFERKEMPTEDMNIDKGLTNNKERLNISHLDKSHMLGGGESYYQGKCGDVLLRKEKEEKNSSGCSTSVMMGAGDNIESPDKVFASANIDTHINTTDYEDTLLVQEQLNDTEKIAPDQEQAQSCAAVSSEASLNISRSGQQCLKHHRESSSVVSDQQVIKKENSIRTYQKNPSRETSYAICWKSPPHEGLVSFESVNSKGTMVGTTIKEIQNNIPCGSDKLQDNVDRNSHEFLLTEKMLTSCCSEKSWTDYKTTKYIAKPVVFTNNSETTTECQNSMESVLYRSKMKQWGKNQKRHILTSSKSVMSSFPTTYSGHVTVESKMQHKVANKCERSSSCPALPRESSYTRNEIVECTPPLIYIETTRSSFVNLLQAEPRNESVMKDPLCENSPVQNHLKLELGIEDLPISTEVKKCFAPVKSSSECINFFPEDLDHEENKLSSPTMEINQSFKSDTDIPVIRLFSKPQHLTYVAEETSFCVSPHIDVILKPTESLADKIQNPTNKEDQIPNSIEKDKTRSVQIQEIIPSARPGTHSIHEQRKGLQEKTTLWTDGCEKEVYLKKSTISHVGAKLMGPTRTCSKVFRIDPDIDRPEQEHRQSSLDKPNTSACLRNKKSRSKVKETIDQFVSVSNAIEIDASSVKRSEHETSENATPTSYSPGGQSNKPFRLFGLGLSANRDSTQVHDLTHIAGIQEHASEFKDTAIVDPHHAKRLSRCVKWVEQNYPYICDRERQKAEKYKILNQKRAKLKSVTLKTNVQKFCDTDFSNQRKDHLHKSPQADELCTKPYRKDRPNTCRTDRRAYTICWLNEHNKLGNIKKRFHSVKGKRLELFLDLCGQKVLNTESHDTCRIIPIYNMNESEPLLNSRIDENERTDDKECGAFRNDHMQLDQNFNKKEKSKKDEKYKKDKNSRKESKSGKTDKSDTNKDKKHQRKDRNEDRSNKSRGRDSSKTSSSGGHRGRRKSSSRASSRDKVPASGIGSKDTKGGGRLGSFKKNKKNDRDREREMKQRDVEVKQKKLKEDKRMRERRHELNIHSRPEEDEDERWSHKYSSSKHRSERSPTLLNLFGIKHRRHYVDRWAEFRPKDRRTLQEDLEVLRAAIGETTQVNAQEDEDVEVPLIFVYLGMCLFMILGALINTHMNPNIETVREAIYFVYVLCSTIGFGDILPNEEGYWFHLLYGLTGVSMFNITVNATLQYMMATLDYLKVVVRKP